MTDTPDDQPQFDHVYEEQSNFVYNLARRLSKTQTDAEDLFQESFLKVLRFLPKFRGGSVRSWVRQIVVTTNISRYRGKKNQPQAALDEHEGWKESIPDESAGPETQAEQEEQKRELNEALERLNESAREILVLREMQGLSYDEIAELLEVPKGTVRSRLARAREALRVVLEGSDG